ncbi:MAG: carboxypeptidase regulatory-like domain-containing protein, partial [Bryobacterales bacterium]|nr:carboxypeptidase regulatory-like domain-containing protein [Bryobacterales bacterium]
MIRLVACLLPFTTLPLFGQTAQISGLVRDPTALAVSGATLTLRHLDTGIAREFKSNLDGFFSAPALVRGRYEVRATAPGFKPQTK